LQDKYPIEEIIPAILDHLTSQQTLILQAPPGAGKSTVLPLHLLKAKWLGEKKILLLQPRRLAARAVADRLAEQLGEKAGQRVGYRIRFDTKISRATQIEVVTEQILTRMLHSDPSLDAYGMIIFDEFHERSLSADLAFVLSRQVQEVLREDLRLLVMSATLETDRISEALKNPPLLKSEGRTFPIDIRYLDTDPDQPIPQRMASAIRRAYREETGDILAFLPGRWEIDKTAELLSEAFEQTLICPLYGDLDIAAQRAAIRPSTEGKRKIVLSTSIAETSLTIEGIRVVVDAGYARVSRFQPRSGLSRLETVNVTQDAAAQRAGRAGRTAPGICYRLWNKARHGQLSSQRSPEIMQADLSSLALHLAQWGTTDIEELSWPTLPPTGPMKKARALLTELGAIDQGKITDLGQEMLRMPTHPRIAHMLRTAQLAGEGGLAADIAAVLEERDPLPREAGADLSLRIEALRSWRKKRKVRADTHILRRLERLSFAWRKHLQVAADDGPVVPESVGRWIAAAYPERVAQHIPQSADHFRLCKGGRFALRSADSLSTSPWLAIAQMDAGQANGRIFLAAPVDPDALAWLHSSVQVVRWDAEKGSVIAREEQRIGDLCIRSKALREAPEDQKIAAICAAIRSHPDLLSWSKSIASWQARILSLRAWREEEDWPDVSKETLVASLGDWLSPYLGACRNRKDLQALDLQQILTGLIPWDLNQKVSQLAPKAFTVPSGSNIKLQYQADGSPPILAARLQEMFGLLESPTINQGRTTLMIHLLSPASRPVQVTQDLHNFWKNTYLDVRKDLRGRYPKHYWPEDPFSAEAIRGVKPKKKQ
jgi:ATP-dependent helicase HrpB